MDVLVWVIAIASAIFDWFAGLLAALDNWWFVALIYGLYSVWALSRHIDARFDRLEKRIDHFSQYRD